MGAQLLALGFLASCFLYAVAMVARFLGDAWSAARARRPRMHPAMPARRPRATTEPVLDTETASAPLEGAALLAITRAMQRRSRLPARMVGERVTRRAA